MTTPLSPSTAEQLQSLRQALFARRNGVVAQTLRQAGDPHRVITGCLLADIVDIARHTSHSRDAAESLWADVNHRECRLLAPMLMPHDEFSQADALRWMNSVVSREEADVLCQRLLQHLSFASDLLDTCGDNPLLPYLLKRLSGWLE
ncbi:MAG: hypothetical protein IJU62_08180 [Muribaculaceae bacterium]|nr:hypothetical protein [Muribaculaceae bacterium]